MWLKYWIVWKGCKSDGWTTFFNTGNSQVLTLHDMMKKRMIICSFYANASPDRVSESHRCHRMSKIMGLVRGSMRQGLQQFISGLHVICLKASITLENPQTHRSRDKDGYHAQTPYLETSLLAFLSLPGTDDMKLQMSCNYSLVRVFVS